MSSHQTDPRGPGLAPEIFDRDAAEHGTFLYTNTTRLSSQLATRRSSNLVLELARFAGKSVVDVGCGDGFYTIRYWDEGPPRSLVGVDAAARAVAIAASNRENRPLHFAAADGHRLPFRDSSFDLALVQSILHHDADPVTTLREALRVAPEILVHEPNGSNLGLKIIERVSPYHREHQERSHTQWQLAGWIEQAGGRVVRLRLGGLVPMFCPNWLARTMKTLEPVIERLPVLNTLACAVVVLVAVRR